MKGGECIKRIMYTKIILKKRREVNEKNMESAGMYSSMFCTAAGTEGATDNNFLNNMQNKEKNL